jgi:hypothetical protein
MNRYVFALAFGCLLAGCQFHEGALVGQRVDDPTAPNAMIHYDQVVILDKYLQSDKQGRIAVESQGARRNPTGTVRVVAQLRNRTEDELRVRARVSFFDAGYAPIDQPSAWQLLVMPPNSIAKYEENSLDAAQVAHYLIEIKGAY